MASTSWGVARGEVSWMHVPGATPTVNEGVIEAAPPIPVRR
jgi:hypothetical protein